MAKTRNRFMRIIVMFDLPTGSKAERTAANNFRSELKKDGYYMLQYSIYGRICNGHNSVKKHMVRLERMLPNYGSVRAIILTEQQYSNIELLLGTESEMEVAKKSEQLIIF